MWMWRETLLQKFVKFGVNLTFFAPCHFEFFQPPKAATHYSGYSYKVSWSLMKGIQNYFKSPLFCFHGNCGKVCPTDSDFFGLSRSTSCGCCSYQISSISVRRITCYDHFCVFQFFSILAISMAMAGILKKSTLNSTTSHDMIFLQGFIKFDRGISEKLSGRIIIRIVKKKRRIAIHHPTTVWVM